jgi:hypothetical protein
MTANNSIDPARFLSEHLERAEPDLLRSMLTTFIDPLMGAEADALKERFRGYRQVLILIESVCLQRVPSTAVFVGDGSC